MITWSEFIYFALPSMLLWMVAGVTVYFQNLNALTHIFTILAIGCFAFFTGALWLSLERPPMRTMGETRLWYSLFLSVIGYLTFLKWKYRWILSFSLLMATVFLVINLLKPEIHSKNLMPALQSVWFIPHVTAYILSYSFLGAATISAIVMLKKRKKSELTHELIHFTDNLVYIGFGLLMTGLLIGAIWAKEAWGHFWSWDPKETWAFITAAAYLVYIHLRLREKTPRKFTIWMVIIAFLMLMITWKGVNYLPAAKNSIHVYTD